MRGQPGDDEGCRQDGAECEQSLRQAGMWMRKNSVYVYVRLCVY